MDYRFYTQLEQILGQEAVSMDEYDRRDEQADQDPGPLLFSFRLFICLFGSSLAVSSAAASPPGVQNKTFI